MEIFTHIFKLFLIFFVTLFSSGILGFYLVKRMGLVNLFGNNYLALIIGFGLTFLLLGFDILLFFGLLKPLYYGCFLVVLLLFLHRSFLPFLNCLSTEIRFLWDLFKTSRFRIFILGLCVLVYAFAFFGLLAPSTGYDSNVYHITLPKIFSGTGSYIVRSDILMNQFPQVLFGLRTASYQIAGEDGIEILNLLVSVVFLISILELLHTIGISKSNLPYGVLLGMGTLQFIICIYDADIELWIAYFFSLLSLVWFLLMNYDDEKLYYLFGLFSAVLVGLKFNSIPGVFALAVSSGIIRYSKRYSLISVNTLIAFVISLIYFFFSYYMVESSRVRDAGFLGIGAKFFSLERFFPNNLYSSLKPVFINNQVFLIYLLCIPFLIFDRLNRIILAIFVLVCIGILATNPYHESFNRYTFYLVPLCIVSISKIIDAFDIEENNKGIRPKFLIALQTLIIISFLLICSVNFYRNVLKIKVVIGMEDKDLYLAKRVCTYKAIIEANKLLSKNDKLLMIAERVQWLDVPYVVGVRNKLIDFTSMTKETFFDFLERENFTHILITDEPAEKGGNFFELLRRDPDLLLDSRLELVYEAKWEKNDIVRFTYIYRIKK